MDRETIFTDCFYVGLFSELVSALHHTCKGSAQEVLDFERTKPIEIFY